MALSTWIEGPARGRHDGPIRAGMWAVAVVGTYPIREGQRVWLDFWTDDQYLGRLPGFWLENRGENSYWHVPIPPQKIAARLVYQAVAESPDEPGPVRAARQEAIVRPNLPVFTSLDRTPEGLIGNRYLTARIDPFGATDDIYFPTVGLHSKVRPAAGDQPRSRTHFQTIVGGLAVGRRLDWFNEPARWRASQHYQGATNILVTELSWHDGPIGAIVTDLAVDPVDLPHSQKGELSPGQCLKRFRLTNGSAQEQRALFGLFVHAEVNGGMGDPRLIWVDEDNTLLASNRGHAHPNRKLSRDATIEFAVALDAQGEVHCEPTGPHEAILLRWVQLPARGEVDIDVWISGAFTGWRGDDGTYEHWIKPALAWSRQSDPERLEANAAEGWDTFLEPVPKILTGRTAHSGALRRAALAAALHIDRGHGSVVASYDRGIHAYCWPRDAIWTVLAMDRVGHPEIAESTFAWLNRVRTPERGTTYWFQKYSLDGQPEWESPSIDQTAMIPWAVEQHVTGNGSLEVAERFWPMIAQAAEACLGQAGHPGLRWLDDLKLISSCGVWDQRFGGFTYSNAAVVAGLRSAVRLADRLGRDQDLEAWQSRAEELWNQGILGEFSGQSEQPGLFDPQLGRFLEARRICTLPGLWSEDPGRLIDAPCGLDISLLSLSCPFDLLPASDPRMIATAEAILKRNGDPGQGQISGGLARWLPDRPHPGDPAQGEPIGLHCSSLATLWMVRYLIRLGHQTGQEEPWNRALTLMETVLARLGRLGLLEPPAPAHMVTPRVPGTDLETSAWGVHASILETILDWTGLRENALQREVTLQPILPSRWPHVGIEQVTSSGRIAYLFKRLVEESGDGYELRLEADLTEPLSLNMDIGCPRLPELGSWLASEGTPTGEAPARFVTDRRAVCWELELPAGLTRGSWQWRAAPIRETQRSLKL